MENIFVFRATFLSPPGSFDMLILTGAAGLVVSLREMTVTVCSKKPGLAECLDSDLQV